MSESAASPTSAMMTCGVSTPLAENSPPASNMLPSPAPTEAKTNDPGDYPQERADKVDAQGNPQERGHEVHYEKRKQGHEP